MAKVTVTSVTLSTADPAKLAAFYEEATGYEAVYESADSVYLSGPEGVRLGFDRVDGFTPPPWSSAALPATRIDLATDTLAETEARLIELGARRPGHERDTEGWIFMADPDGHTFCLTSVY